MIEKFCHLLKEFKDDEILKCIIICICRLLSYENDWCEKCNVKEILINSILAIYSIKSSKVLASIDFIKDLK